MFSIGALFGSVYVVTTIHTLLAFPTGAARPATAASSRWAYLLVTVGVILPLYLFYDPSSDCANCPENVFMIKDSQTAVDIAASAINLLGIVLVGARAPRASCAAGAAPRGPSGGSTRPMYAAGVALMIALIGQLALQSAGSGGQRGRASRSSSRWCPFALVPYLFLGSFVRARLLQGGAVSS